MISPALDNVDGRLAAFWHPVGLAAEPAPTTIDLLGRRFVPSAGAVREHLGLWWFAPQDATAPLPIVEEHDDGSYVVVHSPAEVWSASAGQMADNFLDIGHIPWLHIGSFADPDDRVIPRLSPERTDFGFSVTHHHRTQRLHGDGSGRRVMTIRYTAPFCVLMRLEYLDDDAVITAAFFMQPIDAAHTRLVAVNWRNDIVDGRCTPEETIAFQQRVAAEDRALLERLRDKAIPLDLRHEVHTRADATTLEMRRTLARLLAA
jgi:hypothetical protein